MDEIIVGVDESPTARNAALRAAALAASCGKPLHIVMAVPSPSPAACAAAVPSTGASIPSLQQTRQYELWRARCAAPAWSRTPSSSTIPRRRSALKPSDSMHR